MKIKSLVLLFVGLFLLIIGCELEYLEDEYLEDAKEQVHKEELLDKGEDTTTAPSKDEGVKIPSDESNTSQNGEAGSNQNPEVPTTPSQEGQPATNPETPEVIPPVETPPSQVPVEGQPAPNPETPEVVHPVETPPSQAPVEEQPTPNPEAPEVVPPVEEQPVPTIPEARPPVEIPTVPVEKPQETKPDSPVVPSIPTPDYMKEIGLNIPSDSERDPNQMYFAIKLKGESPMGNFYKEPQSSVFGSVPAAYPKGYEFTFHTEENGRKIFRITGSKDITPGYTDQFGFSNRDGTSMETSYYIGHPRFKMSLQSLGKFSFANFVMTDYTISVFGGFANPDFCRVNASNPLTIEIPMDEYNPSVHKNVARVTILFEPDKNATGNFYTVIFDGFEPK